MEETNNARHAEDLGNRRHDERKTGSKTAAYPNDTTSEDEKAKDRALAWRIGKTYVWNWWVDRLNARLSSGRKYASMRNLTDDVSQNYVFVDDDGRKVTIPHNKGLGRGIVLLMIEEHPEFERLFRLREAR